MRTPAAIATLAAHRSRALHAAAVVIATLLAAVVSFVVAVLVVTALATDRLPGTPLDGRTTPPIRLHDYRGVAFDLDSTRGTPVVLAFLYADCPDVCRLTATGIRMTIDALGSRADDVRFVAVTADPEGDTPSEVRRFLQRHRLQDRLTYLVGDRESVTQIWRDYYIFAGDRLIGLDAHTDAVYLIDRDGRQRALLRSDFDPTELAAALRVLLG